MSSSSVLVGTGLSSIEGVDVGLNSDSDSNSVANESVDKFARDNVVLKALYLSFVEPVTTTGSVLCTRTNEQASV
jgi:hypothetical protein